MKKITIYCGESISDKCGKELHPVKYVERAKEIVLSEQDEIVYTMNPDLVIALKYISVVNNVIAEFFLDGKSCGGDIEPIFEDFNRSIDLTEELCELMSEKKLI